jgi:transposase-like protein
MKSTEFKILLNHLSKLTPKQRIALIQAMDGTAGKEPKTVDEIEGRLEGDLHCPDCKSHNIGKWGKAHGLKRFRCRDCKRTFNALTGTPLARLRKKEQWDEFASAIQGSATVRSSAKLCGVHRNTTFRWRHRFLAWINKNKPPSLHGVVEADETFFLESKKGSRNLGRKARKRGGKASKRGRSSEQVCVLVARDRSGQTTDHVLPAFNADVVDGLLGPAIDSDAMLCTDAANVFLIRGEAWSPA